MHLKMSSVKWQQFCLSLNVLIWHSFLVTIHRGPILLSCKGEIYAVCCEFNYSHHHFVLILMILIPEKIIFILFSSFSKLLYIFHTILGFVFSFHSCTDLLWAHIWLHLSVLDRELCSWRSMSGVWYQTSTICIIWNLPRDQRGNLCILIAHTFSEPISRH